MRERAADLAQLLADPNAYFYVCGLKRWKRAWCWPCAMRRSRPEWTGALGAALKRDGRLHLETC